VVDHVQSQPRTGTRRLHKQTFQGRIAVSVQMTGSGSEKLTRHHEISLQGAPVSYRPGDALGVHPRNDPAVVERILRAIGATGDEPVGSPPMPVARVLGTRSSLAAPSRRLLELMAARGATDLAPLLGRANAAAVKAYLTGGQAHDVVDVLEAHPGVPVTPQELVGSLRTLLPRLYSVASSQRAHPDEVHALVVSLTFTIRGRKRDGVTSSWLNERWALGTTSQMYLQNQQAHFAMPADPATPMIMIGPGTGIAPFRAFLEERRALGSPGRNWLFFGEQHRASEFYYGEELEAFQHGGLLRLDTAFSRDQPQKIYVQHRMHEHARDIWAWLDEGAEVFVCGDKAHMAADVDRELHLIAERVGGKTPEQAREYIEKLKDEKRYKRDVY
jgi:sulfite reductase (NADPH) flavoprotein alpha-component